MNEILDMNSKKMIEAGFDLEAIIVIPGDSDSTARLEEALAKGFEPFAVTPHLIMPKQSSIASVSEPKPTMTIMADKVWLKRRVLMEKNQ